MDNLLFVNDLHLNKLSDLEWDIYADENKHLLDLMEFSEIEGTVFAINKEAIIPYLNNSDVKDIRMGRAKFPKRIKVESQDDFLKFIALYIPLSEYV